MVISNETSQFLRNFLLNLQEMELWLGTKINWLVENQKKWFLFALHSYCHARDMFQEEQHATFEELRITCDCFNFRSCRCTSLREKFYGYWKTFFFNFASFSREPFSKLPYYSCAGGKYPFLSYWLLFKSNEVKILLGMLL